MTQAVDFSLIHVESGGIPFVGQVIDQHGYRSRFGVNRVRETGDPTAHAEIVAMRSALAERDEPTLRGMTLLATGEPCGMCYRFALEHEVSRVVVAIESEEVAELGFDYRASYALLGPALARCSAIRVLVPVKSGREPFRRYLEINRAGRAQPLDQRTTRGIT
ncbi:nucleoside deaminase [Leifsonia aquatica]|uniref:nucleoside deaminase n=1 Tax=Leifsonia aquatica TaxID=144185 RepID=UPI00384C1547